MKIMETLYYKILKPYGNYDNMPIISADCF